MPSLPASVDPFRGGIEPDQSDATVVGLHRLADRLHKHRVDGGIGNGEIQNAIRHRSPEPCIVTIILPDRHVQVGRNRRQRERFDFNGDQIPAPLGFQGVTGNLGPQIDAQASGEKEPKSERVVRDAPSVVLQCAPCLPVVDPCLVP